MAGGHFGCKWLRGDVSAGLPAPPAALLRASLALPGRPTSQSVTPIAVLHSSLHSIIFIIIHHAASAASRERRIPLHRIFGDQSHKTKKQREKKSLRTSGSLQARSQLTKFFLLSFRQAYLPVQVTIMAQGRKMTAAQKAAAKAAREADARSATAASLTEEELTALLKTKRDAAAAAAAKEAADAEAARAAQEAEEAAAPTGGAARSSRGHSPRGYGGGASGGRLGGCRGPDVPEALRDDQR